MLVGLIVAVFAVIGFLVANKESKSVHELSWKKCIFTGLQIYAISLAFGALTTSMVQNAYNYTSPGDYIGNVAEGSVALFYYAVMFTILLVLPALVLGLKFLSKNNLTNQQKVNWFVGTCGLLVIIINATMTSFFQNIEFLIFLSGFSVFGIATPWFYSKRVF